MDQDEVVKNLRSCLISCKGGIKLDNLRGDYRMITGDSLPFKQFGYSTLEAFIRNIPEVIVTRKNGELYVEATPSKTTAHLTKLISKQKARRKIRPSTKKWTPSRYTTRGFSPGAKNNNNYNGFQSTRNNYVNPTFTTSTPGRSNLYTEVNRPILPLMETVVPCPPLLTNNEKSSFAPSTPPISPVKRLTNDVTNPSVTTLNQSVSNYKTIEDLTCKVLNDKIAVPSVINVKPKTAEFRSLLSERLKVSPPRNTIMPRTPLSPIASYNNGHASSAIPSIINKYQVLPPGQVSDPRRDLQIRADTFNLPPPIYKMHSRKDKHSSKITIYASVKVGAHTFHTYPEDAASEEEAEKIAARLALVDLAKESLSPEVTTVDKKLVEERILNIVTKHHSGVFMHLLPEYYCEQYKEALPHNWQKIMEECASINQEKGVGDSMILCRTSPTSKRSENNSTLFKDENSSSSNEKVQLNPIGPAAPGKLILPKTSSSQVYITCVISTAEIWVRFDKYNDNFVEMRKKMTKHFDKKKSVSISSAECVVGDFYAVLEDNYWHRVQCIDFDFETELATVFFIDEGYDEQYKYDVLHPLDKKFCMLSAQATRVALHGLEEFCDYAQLIPEIESHLMVEQLFLAKVHSTKVDEYGSYTTVTFYDISKEEQNANVNQILIDKILKDITIASNLQVGQLIELYVTHIDEDGRVYAQLNSFVRNLVSSEALLQILESNTTTSSAREITFTKTYFAKWDLQLYRARVTNITDNKIIVALLDVGKIVTISKNDLFSMDEMSVLHYIPPQAKQIFLHHLDQSNDERLMARFHELVSDMDLLLARIMKRSQSGIPIVEIFKRIGPNNMLASINTSLIYDSELSKASEDGNNNVNKSSKKRLERRNSRAFDFVGKLNPPTISDIGDYFDVHVTLAAHPGHFIVQPLKDASELKAMMLKLQEYCNKYDGSSLETIGEGKLYAGKFQEEWYRVYVTNIISDHEVSVYFCDFGDVTIVTRSSLQPLRSDFLKLPYQAVKAKLVGIEAMNGDWTVNDCVKFKDLVLDKDFVSVVAESMFDQLSPANGTVLGLRLIDVSTERDIYIDRLLVEEKRAKYIDGFEDLPSS
ncbi:tudor domain-containing protein 7 [Nylanderia fulva]|uniref:tudor domain-containing protein 7 n=1 Tax=Nylanderia fulva TaxID=613905 RepID=UPI0010FB5EAC|nr:tudor domain-containing protein 7 [Nylanderia fulva]XP_029161264.1 tudor domain-containing protein 7 [Nylanderia fulva]XP_029161265.1 tudor domain-containing protein 7 [Nylanderia fulva]